MIMYGEILMLVDNRKLDKWLDLWLDEDIGVSDLTSNIMIDANAKASFFLVSRQDTILCGSSITFEVFKKLDPFCNFEAFFNDGDIVKSGSKLARIEGQARALLSAERLALNLIQRLCGIASHTARYVKEINHTKAALVDTRKTTPGLRMLEKYAVVCGGGRNHRLSLDNGIMLKDNHISIAGGIAEAVRRAKRVAPILTKIEVECDTLSQVEEALLAGVDIIMLDNMTNQDMFEAVKLINGKVLIECSGGVNLNNIKAKAETGVDFISVGRITQSAECIDIGLDQ